ncbi:MAG: hypothetical protein QOG25_2401 [Acetobacteraceae bacterium]|nr:hypothetical protein [Acetobacteraceae bacterium]
MFGRGSPAIRATATWVSIIRRAASGRADRSGVVLKMRPATEIDAPRAYPYKPPLPTVAQPGAPLACF